MEYLVGILATTHKDLEGDKLPKEALEEFVMQANQNIILNNVEHDPRIPPIGRLISAKLVELDDGEFAIEGITEIFDNNFSNPKDLGDRKVQCINYNIGEFSIQFDKGFEENGHKRSIDEIGEIFHTCPSKSIKKSIEPVEILMITGGFILSKFADGFLKELGKDAYLLFKNKLKDIYNKKNKKEKLLKFEFTVINNDTVLNFDFILTNPNELDIDIFMDNVLSRGNEILKPFCEIISDKPVRKIVFEVVNGELVFIFGIREDGAPISIISNDLKNK